jgi:hypothetical protein
MKSWFVARGYDADSKTWFAFPEREIQEDAEHDARRLQDLMKKDALCNTIAGFNIVELAKTDATGEIISQWVLTTCGYHRVKGR